MAFEDVERASNETKLISNLGDYLRGCLNEDEAYEIVQNNMPILFPDTYGSIALFKNSRNALLQAASWGEPPAEVKTEFEPDSCWSLRQGRMHYSKHDGSVPVCEHLKGLNASAVSVCLPMQAQGETSGQIVIGSKNNSEFTPHQLTVMRAVGEQISLALANLNLQKILKEQSIKDPLTKLFNRRYLEETLERETIRANRNKQPLCVLMMDIDHFKKVNDTYGHDAGDAVLVAFAGMLSHKLRKDDIVCRLGGEEFIAIMPAASLDHAKIRAEEINESTRKMKVVFKGKVIPVTVSIGIAQFPEHGDSKEELMANADSALYSAKQTGRNKFVVFGADTTT